MNLPRWLWRPSFLDDLVALDDRLKREKATGAMLIEVHYQFGTPRVATVRPPTASLLQMSLASTSS